jgi:hypothetical protein
MLLYFINELRTWGNVDMYIPFGPVLYLFFSSIFMFILYFIKKKKWFTRELKSPNKMLLLIFIVGTALHLIFIIYGLGFFSFFR